MRSTRSTRRTTRCSSASTVILIFTVQALCLIGSSNSRQRQPLHTVIAMPGDAIMR
jgi:hypothetical protein